MNVTVEARLSGLLKPRIRRHLHRLRSERKEGLYFDCPLKKVMVYMLRKVKAESYLVLLTFSFGFLFFLWIFLRNRLIPMIDGPYYLIQVRSILTTGNLIYGDPPLAFYLLAPFSIIFGDITLGVKVGVSFFCALSTVPAFFLMKRVGKESPAGFFAMLLIIFSAPYIRMMTDFMKNAIGVCWLFAFVYYLHDLAFSGFRKSSLALAAFFLVLTGLTHILDFGVSLLFLASYVALVMIFNTDRISFLRATGIITLVVLTFVIVASTFFSPLFTDFNKVVSFFNDLFAFRRGKILTPAPPHPGAFPRPKPFGPVPPFSLLIIGGWAVIFLVLSFGAILSFYAWRKKEREALLLLTSTTVIGFMLCFPLIPNEWLSRFLLMFVVPTAVILSYGVTKLGKLIDRNQKSNFHIALAMICLLFFVVQSISVAMSVRPTIKSAEYFDLVNMRDQIPPDSVIVVSWRALGYWVQYIDNVDVTDMRNLSPELWRSYSHVLILLPKGKHLPVSSRIIFVGKVFILAELQQK